MKVEEVEYSKVLAVRHKVMYPEKDIDFVKLEDDENGIHVGIYHETNLVSVMSIFLENRDVQFRKLATQKEYGRQGYASTLVKWVIDYAKEMKLNKVWANARDNALPFYEKLGFEKTNECFSKSGYNYTIVEYRIEKEEGIL